MMNNQFDNMVEALSDLRNRGYSKSFSFGKKGLYCPVKSRYFKADEITIEEFHRFEGNTDLEDMAIVYAINTNDNCKGVIIDAYGTYANSNLGDFLKKVSDHQPDDHAEYGS